MLDFHKLKTPPGHGDVLVLPEPLQCARWLRANARLLSTANIPLAGRTLSAWRAETRRKLVGDSDRPLVVIGHQPEFFHPGVWAKHVVARRLADALGGVAINLVVDNDVPRTTSLAVPTVEVEQIRLRQIPFLDLPGLPGRRIYEELPRLDPAKCDAILLMLRGAMGGAFDTSLMPGFFAALRAAVDTVDGVSQLVDARCAVDGSFGVAPIDRRVRNLPWSPLLVEMVAKSARFGECYNAALSDYRREHRVRGKQRPIPDLHISADRVEVPVWAVRAGRARARLFVQVQGKRVTLYAETEAFCEIALDDFAAWNSLVRPLGDGDGWRLRPRALTLTIWARLLLADLFIHGIGGAKYDRITDRIMGDFFQLTPPPFACVSATLHLDLPRSDGSRESVQALRQEMRDWTWNPQRQVAPTPELAAILRRRENLVKLSTSLREGRGSGAERRRAYESIRQCNRAILEHKPDPVPAIQRRLDEALSGLDQDRIATGREYFFALYDRPALERLMATLPASADFRV